MLFLLISISWNTVSFYAKLLLLKVLCWSFLIHPKHLWFRSCLSLKVGSTRRAVAISYGHRCEANVTILEQLVRTPRSLQFFEHLWRIILTWYLIVFVVLFYRVLNVLCTMSFYLICLVVCGEHYFHWKYWWLRVCSIWRNNVIPIFPCSVDQSFFNFFF